MTFGRLFGVVVGVWLLLRVPEGRLSALIGAMIVAGAVMSAIGAEFTINAGTASLAGFASGVMGTSSSVGGPALALVYQRRPGPEVRGTLAISFMVGLILSLTGVAFARRATVSHIILALQLLPSMLLGLWLSRHTHGQLDRGWLRPAILVFAAVAGAIAMVRGLIGT